MSGPVEGSRAAPAPLSADVGIVAALSIEVGFLTDRLEKVRRYVGAGQTVIEGEAGGKLVALVVGGMGRPSAKRAAGVLLDGHHPRWIVSVGFAGALDPTLKRNDLILPDSVVDTEGHAFSVGLTLEADPDTRVRSGRVLTVDAIVRTAAEKAALRERYSADVVDMETSAVAALCSERGVRFLAVRVVSDEAGTDLPEEIVTMLTKSGSYRVGAALRAIWNRPSSLKDFLKLHENAQEAADKLAEATLGVLARLPV